MIPSQFRGTFRKGRVSSVNKKDHTVQVEFFEGDGFVSPDMSMLVTRPGDYALPAKDTPVLCLIVDGRLGEGYVLGALYTDDDAAPLDDAGKRSVASDDLRLGAPDADKKVALAPKINEHFKDQETHFDIVEKILTGPVINEPGLGAPSALQAALKIAISGSPYPRKPPPGDVAAEKVSAK